MEYTVRKSRANRIAMRMTGFFFFLVAVVRLAVVLWDKEEHHVVLTMILCVGGFGYGAFLILQTFKVQAYDITYQFGTEKIIIKTVRKEEAIHYGEISDLGYVVPNENMDYSILQIYIGKEQYVLPFMGKREVGEKLYQMLNTKWEESKAEPSGKTEE